MAESTARLDKNNLLIKIVPYAAYYEVQHGGCQPEPDVIMAMGGCHGFIFFAVHPLPTKFFLPKIL